MSKTFNLTEDQLDFISFMKSEVSSNESLIIRLESRLATLAKGTENSAKQGTSISLQHSPQTMIEFLALFLATIGSNGILIDGIFQRLLIFRK